MAETHGIRGFAPIQTAHNAAQLRRQPMPFDKPILIASGMVSDSGFKAIYSRICYLIQPMPKRLNVGQADSILIRFCFGRSFRSG